VICKLVGYTAGDDGDYVCQIVDDDTGHVHYFDTDHQRDDDNLATGTAELLTMRSAPAEVSS
jgi:hypothetical protein